jgi:hypothetical protein
MSNKRNNPEGTENNSSGKTPPKHQAEKIASFLAKWGYDFVTIGLNNEESIHLLDTLKITYLHHDWADDGEERRQVLLLFEHLETLVENFTEFTLDDVIDTEKLIHKLSA